MEMIERADTDEDGEINPEEFYMIMARGSTAYSTRRIGVYIVRWATRRVAT